MYNVHLPSSRSQRCVSMTSHVHVNDDVEGEVDERLMTEPCDDISGPLSVVVVVVVVVALVIVLLV